jgi:hypothetical protein
LALSESRLHTAILDLQNDILADSLNMSDDAVSHWESVFGIAGIGTKSERVAAILQRQAYPGNLLARQSKTFLQAQLREAGFDVYVNYGTIYDPQTPIYGDVKYGVKTYAQTAESYTVCANKLNEADEPAYSFSDDELKYCFYLGGQTLGTTASVSTDRKKEFRNLILSLKPAHTVAILFINYI